MSSVNKVILVGRLGQDPELRATTSGHNVCTLSLATSKTWTKDGKKETKTEWHRVILWGNHAENARKYLKKGRLLYIEGELQTRSWEDQQGQKRYATEILGHNMQFLESNGDKKTDDYDGYDSEFSSNSRPMMDDIPF
nr:hypothetical protein GTC16762_33040 [Pigmentibacter ruber]